MNNWAKYAVGTALAAAAIGAGGAASADTVNSGADASNSARQPTRTAPAGSAAVRKIDAFNDDVLRRVPSHPPMSRTRAERGHLALAATSNAAMPVSVQATNAPRPGAERGQAGRRAATSTAKPVTVRARNMPRTRAERAQAGRDVARNGASPVSARSMGTRMAHQTAARQPAAVQRTDIRQSVPAVSQSDLMRGVRISRTSTRTVRSESVTDRTVGVSQPSPAGERAHR